MKTSEMIKESLLTMYKTGEMTAEAVTLKAADYAAKGILSATELEQIRKDVEGEPDITQLQEMRLRQLVAQTLVLDESEMMEIADMYEPWVAEKAYTAGKILKYGVNPDGETQLYKVISNFTSQAHYPPDVSISQYKKIGVTDDNVMIWTQPYGATDAYAKGDVVSHKDKIWVCDIDSNVWEPGVYGWSVR